MRKIQIYIRKLLKFDFQLITFFTLSFDFELTDKVIYYKGLVVLNVIPSVKSSFFLNCKDLLLIGRERFCQKSFFIEVFVKQKQKFKEEVERFVLF